MANSPNDDMTRWLQLLARNVKLVATGLLVAAGVAAIATIILLIYYQPSFLPIVFGTIWLAPPWQPSVCGGCSTSRAQPKMQTSAAR